MKRQGLTTTIKELKELIYEMEEECCLGNSELKLDTEHKFQLNIINKEGLSDTWEFEK